MAGACREIFPFAQEAFVEDAEKYMLMGDCTVFNGMFDFCQVQFHASNRFTRESEV